MWRGWSKSAVLALAHRVLAALYGRIHRHQTVYGHAGTTQASQETVAANGSLCSKALAEQLEAWFAKGSVSRYRV